MLRIEPELVAATLMNRVLFAGTQLLAVLGKSKAEVAESEIGAVRFLKANYCLAYIELVSLLKVELAHRRDTIWRLFVIFLSNLQPDARVLYRGIVRDIERAASNALARSEAPLASATVATPDYIARVAELEAEFDPEFWNSVLSDAVGVRAASKGLFNTNAGELIAGAAGAFEGATGLATATTLTAGAGAFVAFTVGSAMVVDALCDYAFASDDEVSGPITTFNWPAD